MPTAPTPAPAYSLDELKTLGSGLATRYAPLLREGVPPHLAMPLRAIQVQAPRLSPLPTARALVVEDDPHVRVLAELVLDDIALVIGCESAESALAVMRAHGKEIAFVLADVRLAGPMKGCELARTISARWPATRMVLTSTASQEMSASLPQGVDFLPKPWRCDALRALAQSAIRQP